MKTDNLTTSAGAAWHALWPEAAAEILQINCMHGLLAHEARLRLEKTGPNRLPEQSRL